MKIAASVIAWAQALEGLASRGSPVIAVSNWVKEEAPIKYYDWHFKQHKTAVMTMKCEHECNKKLGYFRFFIEQKPNTKHQMSAKVFLLSY